jgi:cell wall-associated NlpC family hydrolase
LNNKTLDKRLNAFRPDLADETLRGKVDASHFIKGRPAVVSGAYVDVRKAPSPDGRIDTQFLLGDRVRVFDSANGWAWVQGERDGYVGHVAEAGLALGEPDPETHRVIVPRTFVYPSAELKDPPVRVLSMGSRIHVAGEEVKRDTRYAVLSDGTAIVATHLADPAENSGDYVSVAEMFLHTPYLWGGATAFGIDCSGLVQLAMFMTGRNVLRDSDMQENSLGEPLDVSGGFGMLERGDLVFWEGHVGIMANGGDLLHANGKTMTVSVEPLAAAIRRIEPLYGLPTSARRP